jgi:KamA family protein
MSPYKKKNITKLEDIKDYQGLDESTKKDLQDVVKRHPMRIPREYYELIDWDNENDPIRKLSIPDREELSAIGDYDTSGEASNTKLPGVQHKYSTTVLVLSTNVCFVYCRHCFRKRMVGYSKEEINSRMAATVKYVRSHKEVNNVLITGGDSFTMSTKMIEKYLSKLTDIDHLDFIRFGTRAPVVQPSRILDDPELLNILSTYSKKKEIIIITQTDHARELSEKTKEAVDALKKAGCIVRNQAVLLKGINDTPQEMADLLNKLMRVGIHPYYVFQCRPVKGATHFQVPLSKGIDIINETRKRCNGLSKGFRYIMSHPRGKVEIIDKVDNTFYFKFHQNKYEEDANKFFTKPVDEVSNWLDESLNPIEK